MKFLMNTFLLVAAFCSLHAQTIPALKQPNLPGFEISLIAQNNSPTLEQLAARVPTDHQSAGALTMRLKHDVVDYEKVSYVQPLQNFMPTLNELYGRPFLNLNGWNDFEPAYRLKNAAFYEANKNTILGSAYDNFCPSASF